MRTLGDILSLRGKKSPLFSFISLLLVSVFLSACGSSSNSGTVQISGTVSSTKSSAKPRSDHNHGRKKAHDQRAAVSFAGGTIYVINSAGVVIGSAPINADGTFTVNVPPGTDYFLRAVFGNTALTLFLPDATMNETGVTISPYTTALVDVLGAKLGNSDAGKTGTSADVSTTISGVVSTGFLTSIGTNTEVNGVASAIASDITTGFTTDTSVCTLGACDTSQNGAVSSIATSTGTGSGTSTSTGTSSGTSSNTNTNTNTTSNTGTSTSGGANAGVPDITTAPVLTLTSSFNPGSASFRWTAVPGANGYYIFYGTSPNVTFANSQQAVFLRDVRADRGGSIRIFGGITGVVSGLAKNTTYYFAASAANSVGHYGAFSNVVSATTTAPIVQLGISYDPHTLALLEDGTVWSAGYNGYGELGDGTTTERHSPVQVCAPGATAPCATFLSNIKAVAAGGRQSLALDKNGNVWAWGENSDDQLGDGTTTDRHVPVQVCAPGQTFPCSAFLSNIKAIAAGELMSMALDNNGNVWAWGYNSTYASVGDGTSTPRNIPVQVCTGYALGACTSFLSNIKAIAGEYDITAAVDASGNVWTWGSEGGAPSGVPDGSTSLFAVQVTGLPPITSVELGDEFVVALDGTGNVWAWGYNHYGQLGNGGTSTNWTPAKVLGQGGVGFLSNITALSVNQEDESATAIDGAGHVWGWGDNGDGNLGDGTTTQRDTPVEACVGDGVTCTGPLTGAVSVTSSYSTLAIMKDGSIMGWGCNGNGELGVGTTNQYYTAVPAFGPLGGFGVGPC